MLGISHVVFVVVVVSSALVLVVVLVVLPPTHHQPLKPSQRAVHHPARQRAGLSLTLLWMRALRPPVRVMLSDGVEVDPGGAWQHGRQLRWRHEVVWRG